MKPRTAFQLTLLLCCAIAPGSLLAQTGLVRTTIDSGTNIRMHKVSGTRIRGRLLQPLDPTSVMIVTCRYPTKSCSDPADTTNMLRIASSSLTKIEVQRGTKWKTGAVLGGTIGAILGLLVGSFAEQLCESASCADASSSNFAATGALGVGIIGALIGTRSPRWGPTP